LQGKGPGSAKGKDRQERGLRGRCRLRRGKGMTGRLKKAVSGTLPPVVAAFRLSAARKPDPHHLRALKKREHWPFLLHADVPIGSMALLRGGTRPEESGQALPDWRPAASATLRQDGAGCRVGGDACLPQRSNSPGELRQRKVALARAQPAPGSLRNGVRAVTVTPRAQTSRMPAPPSPPFTTHEDCASYLAAKRERGCWRTHVQPQ
jgi:hypothetical protein